MKLNKDDLDLINLSLNGIRVFSSIDEIMALPKKAIISIIDSHLASLIGYDKKKDDIDNLGERADNVISKLLILLRNRNEM